MRVKKGLRGQRKRPLPREKGPRGPCDPLPNTSKRKMDPERPCPNGRGRCALPWPSLGRRAGAMAWGYASYDDGSAPSSACEKNSRKTQRNGEKEKQGKRSTENPCRLASQEKGLRRSKENPKNARGPEWHPEKTPRSGTHGQNGQKQTRRDTKTEKEKAKQVRVGVCPVTT